MVSKRKEKKQEKLLEKDLMRILLFGAALVVLYFITSYYFKSLNQFDYQGLSFTRERFDKDMLYHYYYYYTKPSGQIIQYNLYLHIDPRTNNVTVQGDPLLLEKPYVYLTYDDSFPDSCQFVGSSVVDLNLFLKQNQITVFSGITNETKALETSQEYISCKSKPDSAEVFEFYAGNETSIVVAGNCHRVYIGPDCGMRDAIEKLKVEIIKQARERALS